MKSLAVTLRSLPFIMRWAVVGAVSAGALGAIAGLVVGLFAYAPTAPFAAVEIGLPAFVAGGVAGLAAGVIAAALSRLWHARARIL